MTINEFAQTVVSLSAEEQNEFFEILKDQLSEEDWLATVKFISLNGLFLHPGKYNAMKEALLEVMFEEIFGHERTVESYVSAKSLLGYENKQHFPHPQFGIHK